jgi:Fe-S-cluster containining protein
MATQKTFAQMSEENPCEFCPAPCCRMQLMPQKVPRTYLDLDYLRYLLLFPNTEIVISSDGSFSLLKWQICHLLETQTCKCSVHGTPQKPHICVFYSPYNCWYKRNFVEGQTPETYRLNLARFNCWVNEITLSEEGQIISVPSFEKSQEIVSQIPIEVTFQMDLNLIKDQVTEALQEREVKAGMETCSSPPDRGQAG